MPDAQFTVTPIFPQAQPEENTIITPPTPEPLQAEMSDDIARQRAFKAKSGMGEVLPQSEDQLRTEMANGQDGELRKQAASKKMMQDEINKQRVIRDVIDRSPNGVNQQDLDFISNTYDRAISSSDPMSIFEEAFSKYYIGQADRSRTTQPGTVVDDVANEMPKVYDKLKETGDTVLAKREFAITQAQNAEAAVKAQTWVGWGLDQLKTAVPLYTSAKLRGWMKDTPIVSSDSGFGLGANLYDQTRELLRLPLPEYKAKFTEIMDKLKRDNPSMAVTWARAVTGMSTSEENLQSAFELFDIATLTPIAAKLGKAAIAKAGMIHEAKEAMKDLAKSVEGEEVSKAKMAQGMGDALEAGIQKQTEINLDLLKGQPKPVKEALEALPQYLKIDAEQTRTNPGHLGQEVANRLAEKDINAANQLMEVLVNRTTVDKIPAPLATEEGLKAVYASIKDEFRGIKNAIHNIRITGIDPISNATMYEMDIGRSSGVLFAKPLEARNFARANGLGGYDLVRQGGGYKLTIGGHINETGHVIRDGLLNSEITQAPKSWVDAFMVNRLRSPQDTMSQLERANRILADTAPASIMKLIEVEAQDIQRLASKALPGTTAKQKFQEWSRVVNMATDMKDKDGNRGVFFNHPGELDHAYTNLLNRLPDEEETAAYFAFKRITEMDRVLRIIRVYANKARLGVAQHRFSQLDENGNRIWSPYFEARVTNKTPGGSDTILIVGKNDKESLIRTADQMDPDLKKTITRELNEGKAKMLEIYSVNSRPLENFGIVNSEHRVRYVFTRSDELTPLSWDQVPRRGGGHFGYEFEQKLVQPRIRTERVGAQVKHWYEDDVPIAGLSSRAMGKDAAEKFTAVAKIFERGDEAGAKAYWEQHFPVGISWEDVKGWFSPTYLNGKKQPPRLRTDIPFFVVDKNTKSADVSDALEKLFYNKDTGKSTFNDGTKRGSLERNYQVEFTQQRDNEQFLELTNRGTAQEPLYSFEPAKKIDPIVMMNRAISKITQATWLEDYKHAAIEHWIEEARHLLKDDVNEVRAAPMYQFEKADKFAFRSGADPIEVNRLLVRREQIKQFLGVKDRISASLERAGQNMLDIAYEAKGIGKAAYVPTYALSRIRDPFSFIRAVTFHNTMGLFNWTQVFNQLQSFVTIFGVAGPSKALPGTVATLLHEWSAWSRNPNIMKMLDEKATQIHLPGTTKWKSGWFTESVKAMESTGFDKIGAEVALVDNRLNENVIRGNFQRVLDAGTVFFKWPESKIRMGAWHTSYLEFRTNVKPNGRLTNSDRLVIRRRADDLYQNMTSASVSLLQRGIASIPTQFLTYQIRAAELFLGKRLGDTMAQRAMIRARLFATLAVAYGVPSAMGVTGFPFAEFIKKNRQEAGYVPGQNPATTSLMEGLVSTIGAVITGGGDMTKGTYYNLSEKGVNGMDLIKDVIRGDKSIITLALGASGTQIANTLEASSGFYASTLSAIRGDGKFPYKTEDFLDPFRQIRSLDKALKLRVMLNTGRMFTKSGDYLGDVTKMEALTMTALGLTKEDMASVNLQNWSLKDQRKERNDGYKKFAQEYRRGLLALQNNDPEGSVQYFKRARNYLTMYGYDAATMPDAYARIGREQGSLIDRTKMDFYIKKAPLAETDDRLKAFQERSSNQNIRINGQ